MASIFVAPKASPTSAGDNYSAARYYFYDTGTTTPAVTYQDADFTTEHEFPVEADANGVFPVIYLDPSVSYRIQLKTSADALIYDVDPYESIASAEAIGGALNGQEDVEADHVPEIVPSRYRYAYGNLKRYTSNNGDGSTDISEAFQNMLESGALACVIPAPESAWVIGSTVNWIPGVTVTGPRGCYIISTVASGEWTFKFYQIAYSDGGAGLVGFRLKCANDGANGIQIYESRNVNIEDFNISTNATLGGIALELNGGDNASSFEGCHHNYINNGFIYRHATGIRMYSDNTTSGSNTANCNRNKIGVGGFIHINDCTTGLFMNRANTNNVSVSLQGNDTGANIGQYSDRNTFLIQSESNTYPVVLSPSANNNVFGGNLAATSFVDAVGVQVTPHLSTVVVSANEFMFPRVSMLANGGTLRFANLFGSAGRLRMEDTYDHDLSLASHDASDTSFDVFTAKYHSTAPYGHIQQLCQVTQIAQTQANVASATDITYITTSGLWRITGTTTINTITAPSIGNPKLVLIFTANTTVNDDSTSSGNIVLAGGANFSGTADDALTLVWNSTSSKWIEVSRSVN